MDIRRPPFSVTATDLETDLKQRLLKRLHWMHTLRWIAAAVVLFAGMFTFVLFDLDLAYLYMGLTLLLLCGSNVVFNIWLNRFEPETTDLHDFNKLVYTEIATDFLILASLIHFTGGISNFFSFYYVFHLVIASILVPRKTSYFLAASATFIVGSIALLEMSGLLHHYSLGPFAPIESYKQPWYIFHFMIVFSGLVFTMAYIGSNLRMMIQRREGFLKELKERLEVWNRQIMVANERLSEIDRTKTQFMHLSGHEIRSPLSAMLSIMRTILEGYVQDHGKILEMIGLANRRANEALEITNKLLQLAREKGKDLEPEEFELAAETETVLENMEDFALLRDVKLELLSDDMEDITVNVDRESFHLALENILSNAIKYSYPNGKVTVHVEKWRNKAMVIIVDRGIGIPEEFMPGIFDEFSRARNARKLEHAGTGLGMPIVRQGAVNMGGTITVRSIHAQGTVVRLTMPLFKPGENEQPAPAPVKPAEVSNENPENS